MFRKGNNFLFSKTPKLLRRHNKYTLRSNSFLYHQSTHLTKKIFWIKDVLREHIITVTDFPYSLEKSSKGSVDIIWKHLLCFGEANFVRFRNWPTPLKKHHGQIYEPLFLSAKQSYSPDLAPTDFSKWRTR